MNSKHFCFGRFVRLITFSFLCLLVYSSSVGIAIGQKKPSNLKLDVDMDDDGYCGKDSLNGKTQIEKNQFCRLYALYEPNKDGNAIGKATALNARNDMIDLVVGQVDTYFKLRKDGRRTKIRLYESILDFLRIGGELAVTIMNGERAKTIIGATLAGLDTGRTKFDKNFEILETQILVNNMIAKRARLLTEIIKNKDKPVRAAKPSDAYSWIQAKNDLRNYLLAGTFDDALDTLIKKSGADVVAAEKELALVTENDVFQARNANEILTDLEIGLGTDDTRPAATKALRAIVIAINNDDEAAEIKSKLEAAGITATSEGDAILKALKKIRRDFNLLDDRTDLVNRINQAIKDNGNIN